jgi:hypothetical protein
MSIPKILKNGLRRRKQMKKKIAMIVVIFSIGLTGCTSKTESISSTSLAGTLSVELDHDTKKEIYAYIISQIDSLMNLDMSDEDGMKIATKIREDVMTKYDITLLEYSSILDDKELAEEYQLEELSNATLENDGSITYPSQDVVVVGATEMAALNYGNAYYSFCLSNDSSKIDLLKRKGEIFYVLNGTNIKYAPSNYTDVKIEIIEGEYKGKTGYVDKRQIVPK